MAETIVKYYPRRWVNADDSITYGHLKRTYIRTGAPKGRPSRPIDNDVKQDIYNMLDAGASIRAICNKHNNVPYSQIRRFRTERLAS